MAGPLQPFQQLAPKPALAAGPGIVVPAPQAVAPVTTPAPMAHTPITPEQQALFDRNKAYIAEGDHTYQTVLTPQEEAQFQQYIADKSDAQDRGRWDTPVYDMRGWWKAMLAGDEKAQMQIDPNDGFKHRNDYWKTPYHESFSAESQWAGQNAPQWNDKDQLVAPDGTVVYDDRAQKPEQ